MLEKGRRGYTGKLKGVPKGFAAMDKDRLREISRAAIRKRWAAPELLPSPLQRKLTALDRMLKRLER
jgi:hypothetical protein